MGERWASILLVGDELLAGEITDRNGPFLAEQLTGEGFPVREFRTLPDDIEAIGSALREAASASALVVLCGGLGPTSDDRTTAAVSRALDRPAVLDEEQWERIRQIFAVLRGVEPPPGNEKQAMVPEGADILPNEMGTAVGYALRTAGAAVAVLPGPPRENQPMFRKALVPWLDRNLPDRTRWRTRVFRVFGLPESEVGHRLRELEPSFPALRVSYQFHFPEILVKLRGRVEVAESMERASRELEGRLSPYVYARGERRLPEVLGQALVERGLRVVTAESCTGGLAAKLLTDTAGSSAWMEKGYVVYSNEAKMDLLGVPGDLLERHGAVSEPVARAMLMGALNGARDGGEGRVGLAITGIAGPAGGTPEKPVGTVCIAWGDRRRCEARTHAFRWDRDYNRLVSAWAAIHHLVDFLP